MDLQTWLNDPTTAPLALIAAAAQAERPAS
jgi:hypothetical protein